MSAELLAARRAYEWGRLRTSLRRALFVVAPVAVVSVLLSGPAALAWLPVTLTAWVLAHWRGGPVLGGAFLGLLGGVVTYALPMSILRPCCSAQAMAVAGRDCCTRPGACLGAGVLVGLAVALGVSLTQTRRQATWQTAAGVALGTASVAVLKCSTLYVGEAVGLVGGVLAGLVAATAAQVVLGRRAAR
jgi:hypothetical protein